MLFNTMLIHGYTPSVILKSTILPIPKDYKTSLSSSDNYRGISLFNCICKLYDHVILHLFRKELTASEMQFGFKEHHSTTLCNLIFTEVISTYVNNNSSVYSCLLDASKALDLVHYGKQFEILISKDLSKSVICLYFDNYLRQIYCVIWRDYKSEYFNVSIGVKQGGIISSIFFSLYIDPLLLT